MLKLWFELLLLQGPQDVAKRCLALWASRYGQQVPLLSFHFSRKKVKKVAYIHTIVWMVVRSSLDFNFSLKPVKLRLIMWQDFLVTMALLTKPCLKLYADFFWRSPATCKGASSLGSLPENTRIQHR